MWGKVGVRVRVRAGDSNLLFDCLLELQLMRLELKLLLEARHALATFAASLEVGGELLERAARLAQLGAHLLQRGETGEDARSAARARAAGERPCRVVEVALEGDRLDAEGLADGARRLLVRAHDPAPEDVGHRRRKLGGVLDEIEREIRLVGADELLGLGDDGGW